MRDTAGTTQDPPPTPWRGYWHPGSCPAWGMGSDGQAAAWASPVAVAVSEALQAARQSQHLQTALVQAHQPCSPTMPHHPISPLCFLPAPALVSCRNTTSCLGPPPP